MEEKTTTEKFKIFTQYTKTSHHLVECLLPNPTKFTTLLFLFF